MVSLNIYKWHAHAVTYIIFAIMLAIFVSVALMVQDKSFFHWGPGASNGAPVPNVLGISIDKGEWGAYVGVMITIAILQFFDVWRFSVVTRYKQTEIKSKQFEYKRLCEEANVPMTGDVRKSSRCDAKFRAFKVVDSLLAAMFKLIPVLVLSSTRQFQYMLPVIIVEVLGGLPAITNELHGKFDYGKSVANYMADANAEKMMNEMKRMVSANRDAIDQNSAMIRSLSPRKKKR